MAREEKGSFKKLIAFIRSPKLYYVLGGVGIMIGIVAIVYPLYPEIQYRFDKVFHKEKFTSEYYLTQTTDQSENVGEDQIPKMEDSPLFGKDAKEVITDVAFDKSTDRIIFPSIGTDALMYYGYREEILNMGAWMKDSGSQPGENGNVIVTGHKFNIYNGQSTFYHLDKVKTGDDVIITWGGRVFTYTVTESFVVDPVDVWVENKSDTPKLTVYTCEGLDATKRRVVVATPKNE